MTWRDIAKPIIAGILAANAGADDKTIRRRSARRLPVGRAGDAPVQNLV